MSELGTASRHAIGDGFDVMADELDWIVNRLLGIDEFALATKWMQLAMGRVGEPPSVACSGTDAGARGGSPTRHLVAVPAADHDRAGERRYESWLESLKDHPA